MRKCICLIVLWVLTACGGGGGSGGVTPAAGGQDGSDGWRGRVTDITTLVPALGSAQPIQPAAAPHGKIGLSGGFGARVGGTDKAVFGAAHMLADFDTARVQGWVDQAGLYDVDAHLPLLAATPVRQEDLTGRLVFDGAIELRPPYGERIWFDAGYTGTLSGPRTVLDIAARTDRGAFVAYNGGVAAQAAISGSASLRQGARATREILREGQMFVREN